MSAFTGSKELSVLCLHTMMYTTGYKLSLFINLAYISIGLCLEYYVVINYYSDDYVWGSLINLGRSLTGSGIESEQSHKLDAKAFPL